jgi:hypothetical protein
MTCLNRLLNVSYLSGQKVAPGFILVLDCHSSKTNFWGFTFQAMKIRNDAINLQGTEIARKHPETAEVSGQVGQKLVMFAHIARQ